MVQSKARPRTRAVRAREQTEDEIFLEENADRVSRHMERGVGEYGEAQTFTHTGADLVVLYFPTSWGWESREVPSTNVRMLMGAGARRVCGDCGTSCSPDPLNPQFNNCPGRPKFAARQCPVCGRLIYDFEARSVNADLLTDVNPADTDEADGVLISNDDYSSLTPASRTKAKMDRHIRAYHPETADAMGIERALLGPQLPGT